MAAGPWGPNVPCVTWQIVDIISVNIYKLDKNWRPSLSATSRVIRAKRVERVTPNAVMAAQSMGAALAVGSFLMLDSDRDGVISANDIISAFARVGGVSYEQVTWHSPLLLSYRGFV